MKNTTSTNINLNHNEGTKNHNSAVTSLESFKIINETGQRIKEKGKVLDAITRNQPITSRALSKLTGIERTNITRSLFDLVHDTPPLIKEAYTDKCPVTNRRVNYYSLIDWQPTLFPNAH